LIRHVVNFENILDLSFQDLLNKILDTVSNPYFETTEDSQASSNFV